MGLDVYLVRVCSKDEYNQGGKTHKILLEDEHRKEKLLPMFLNKSDEVTLDYIDFASIFKKRKLDYNDYIFHTQSGNVFEFIHVFDKDKYPEFPVNTLKITINTKSPVLIEHVKLLYCKQVAYLRKGANAQFYKDNVWRTGGYICSRAELEEHYHKYFCPEWVTDYRIPEPRHKFDDFKYKILDNFIEGEMILCYW